MSLSNTVVDQFIIEQTLIKPLNDIITKLEKRDFRDCDIKWLDGKLEAFTKLACETLGMSALVPIQIESEKYTILNAYVTQRYLQYFNTLLNYFKSF